MRPALLIALLGSLAFGPGARGDAEIGAAGSVFRLDCDSSPSLQARVTVAYRLALPEGSQISLVHALGGWDSSAGSAPRAVLWRNVLLSTLKAGPRDTWSTTVDRTLFYRGSSTQYTELEFTLEIYDPSRGIYYDNGSAGSRGYYSVHLNRPQAPCVGRGTLQRPTILSLHRVRWPENGPERLAR
jgi:hypothetical protein